MKFIDNILQDRRINEAKKFIANGSKVLDIGSVDGILFNRLRDVIKEGVGIDPTLTRIKKDSNYTLFPGYFPKDLPQENKFNVITMLAVLEHIPVSAQKSLVEGCYNFLEKGGKVIITVPSPNVDYILNVLKFFRLIDGMSLEEHFGFDVKSTDKIFGLPKFKMICHRKFQLGLNNLFVFEKI